LRCLDIDLTYKSLALLLHICSVPAFRDKIEVIYLRHSSSRDTVDDDEPYIPPGGEYEDHLRNEDIQVYIDSSEAIYLLAACFRELSKGSLIQKIAS
jgi:hypothetical protein